MEQKPMLQCQMLQMWTISEFMLCSCFRSPFCSAAPQSSATDAAATPPPPPPAGPPAEELQKQIEELKSQVQDLDVSFCIHFISGTPRDIVPKYAILISYWCGQFEPAKDSERGGNSGKNMGRKYLSSSENRDGFGVTAHGRRWYISCDLNAFVGSGKFT